MFMGDVADVLCSAADNIRFMSGSLKYNEVIVGEAAQPLKSFEVT